MPHTRLLTPSAPEAIYTFPTDAASRLRFVRTGPFRFQAGRHVVRGEQIWFHLCVFDTTADCVGEAIVLSGCPSAAFVRSLVRSDRFFTTIFHERFEQF